MDGESPEVFAGPLPVDSDRAPVAVLLQDSTDIRISVCGKCGRPAGEWPRISSLARPGVMFRAELFCADCFPRAYDPVTGRLVDTLTGR